MKFDPYQRITARVLNLLEEGVAPWHQPWDSGPEGWPKNLVSKREYSGINVLLLGCQRRVSPWWLTFNQAKNFGGSVRKGERGTQIVFWKVVHKDEAEEDEGKGKSYGFLKVYTVFNTDQCDLPEGVVPDMMMIDNDHDPVATAAAIAAGYRNPPTVREMDGRAYYRPSCDLVSLPPLKRFETPESFYSTLFHELGHSTGHKDRLDRLAGDSIFGDHSYSEEELVAEMTAAFLCGRAGIINSTIDSSVAYLGSWSKRLKGDKKLIVRAASHAQKAADMILGDSVAA